MKNLIDFIWHIQNLPWNKASLYEISNNKRDSHQVPVYIYTRTKKQSCAKQRKPNYDTSGFPVAPPKEAFYHPAMAKLKPKGIDGQTQAGGYLR